jgi:hypothetical protein
MAQFDKANELQEWAEIHVRASLSMGHELPEIQRRLVARGLTPEAAASVMASVLGTQVRGHTESIEAADRRRRMHRLLSAVVAVASVLLAYFYGGGWSVYLTLRLIVLPLICIWFADEIADTAKIPGGGILRAFAWIPLIAVCAYRIVLVLD